jgi:hypothetical protein
LVRFSLSLLIQILVANTDVNNPNLKKDLLIAANALHDHLQKMMAAVTAVADVTGITKVKLNCSSSWLILSGRGGY